MGVFPSLKLLDKEDSERNVSFLFSSKGFDVKFEGMLQ